MLDTLLEIGRKLRQSPDGLRHHRYIKPAPMEVDKTPVRFFRVPVNADGSFDFAAKTEDVSDHRATNCFFLNYKAGEADSSKPYVFGDVFRSIIVKGKAETESGNYKLANPQKKSWSALSSFTRFEKPPKVVEGATEQLALNGTDAQGEALGEGAKAFLTPLIKTFRRSFGQQQKEIEAFIAETRVVYLRFDFNGKGWHELPNDRPAIDAMILSNFAGESPHGYILKSFLFKTIGVGGGSSTPGFGGEHAHKVRRFTATNEIEDLIYALNYAGRAAVRERDIKIIVLPRGDNLTAKQIERFFDKTGLEENEESENEVKREATINTAAKAAPDVDPLFAIVPERDDSEPNLLQFDFIFSLAGGTKPDVDLVELSGLERSRLSDVSRRVRTLRREIKEQRQAFLNTEKELAPPTITRSFLNILGDATKGKKKYQNHLLRALPQIYSETYVHDPVLLPALIEKTEANIRDDSPDFNLLKWDFYFLARLQNTQGDRLMEIQNSPSYHVGRLLGTLARPLRSRINSFDKNYAGLLSRRIATKPDLMAMVNELNQKLIMHDCVGFTHATSHEMAQTLKTFSGRYDADECAFGFFESYYEPFKKNENAPDDNADETQTPEPALTA